MATKLTDKNLLLAFQSSSQLELQSQIDDGHCVWYGVCYKADKIKNCAYDGPPKALNASGVDDLKQWCSHLLPQNYVYGQEVKLCCDNTQVRDLRIKTSSQAQLSIFSQPFSCRSSTKTSSWLRIF